MSMQQRESVDSTLRSLETIGVRYASVLNGSIVMQFPGTGEWRIMLTETRFFVEEVPTSSIVEFKEPSLIEKQAALKNEVAALRERSATLAQAKRTSSAQRAATDALRKEESQPNELAKHRQKIAEEHAAALADINQRLEAKGTGSAIRGVHRMAGAVILKITGYAIFNEPLNPETEFYAVLNGVVINVTATEAAALTKSPYVKRVSPNRRVHTQLMESVPLIGADEAWNVPVSGGNLTGAGVSISIMDTGVDYTHPDLGNCTTEQFLAHQCVKVVGGYDFVNDDDDPMDDQGHGTHVAATAAGNGTFGGTPIESMPEISLQNQGSYVVTITGALAMGNADIDILYGEPDWNSYDCLECGSFTGIGKRDWK